MRLLFEKGFAPTHAFSAFYRYLREDFGAHALLHFGTHGALEFMPGKQSGMSGRCWPDRLIDDIPNLYLYASNNPSEGTIAKRRTGATLVSYLTPPLTHAGLYRGLLDLKESIDSWRGLTPAAGQADSLAELIQTQAAGLSLAELEPVWGLDAARRIEAIRQKILEMEHTLIPFGLHVVGQAPSPAQRVDLLMAIADSANAASRQPLPVSRAAVQALVDGKSIEASITIAELDSNEATLALFRDLERSNQRLCENRELEAILHGLDGGFLRPAREAISFARRTCCPRAGICTALIRFASRAPSR